MRFFAQPLPIVFAAVLGAVLGMTLPAAQAEDQVAATVNGEPITQADLALAEREMGADLDLGPEERRRVLLEVLVQRQVLAAAAEDAKLDAGAGFDERLAYARRALLQELFLEKEARAAVSEADARRLYDDEIATLKPEGEEKVPAFAEMKDDIVRVLAKNKAKDLVRDLRAKASITYNDANLAPEPLAGSPSATVPPSP